jgi:hypothetical protein
MNLANAILQKTYQESYLQYTKSVKLLKKNSEKLIKEANDKVELSTDTINIKELGLKLTDSFVLQTDSNIEFKYNFTDSLIQVQSKGNYNLTEKSGNVDLKISFLQKFEKNGNALTINPAELNVSMNFNLVENKYTMESGSSIKKPDMFTIVQKIIAGVLDIIKDGQDKDIRLTFQNNDTLKDLFQYADGKIAKMLYLWLELIARRVNPYDKNGKRDHVTLLIPDEKWQIDYEKRDLTINISNLSISMKLLSGETQTIMLTDIKIKTEEAANPEAA